MVCAICTSTTHRITAVSYTHLDVYKRQTISFGDGGNDVDMLEYTGIGVAMGNATEAPKSVADYVTDDVDHDGIMNALKHFGIL